MVLAHGGPSVARGHEKDAPSARDGIAIMDARHKPLNVATPTLGIFSFKLTGSAPSIDSLAPEGRRAG